MRRFLITFALLPALLAPLGAEPGRFLSLGASASLGCENGLSFSGLPSLGFASLGLEAAFSPDYGGFRLDLGAELSVSSQSAMSETGIDYRGYWSLGPFLRLGAVLGRFTLLGFDSSLDLSAGIGACLAEYAGLPQAYILYRVYIVPALRLNRARGSVCGYSLSLPIVVELQDDRQSISIGAQLGLLL
jgi:hypothetical protein